MTTEDPTGTSTSGTSETSTSGTSETSTSGTPATSTSGTSETSTTGSIECIPLTGGDASSGSTTETTGDPGDPLVPIESWQAYVVAECTAIVECGCLAPKSLGKDLATCMAIRTTELGDLAAEGYTWDADCAAARVAGVTRRCDLEKASCEASSCNLFHGTAAYADPCAAIGEALDWKDASDCATDLYCSDGVCITPCSDEIGCGGDICGPDERCLFEDEYYCADTVGVGHFCEPLLGIPCADGLVCGNEGSDRAACEYPAAECEPCISVCETGHYCDMTTKLCWPRRPVGAPCAVGEECQSRSCGMSGMGGQCDPPAQDGEPCAEGPCAEGLQCGSQQLCAPILHQGEPCPGLNHCAPGLSCTFAAVCEAEICDHL